MKLHQGLWSLAFFVLFLGSLSEASVPYEVWGGNANYLSEPSWWDYYYNIDEQDYTKLGDGSAGTMSFAGSYDYYVIAVHQKTYIDCIQGFPGGLDIGGVGTTGNTSDWNNLAGQPDEHYATLGNRGNPGSFSGFVVVDNPGGWTGITVFDARLSEAVAEAITKFTVKAGRTEGADSAQFAGLLNATTSDLETAGEIVVGLESADMDELEFVFPIDADTYKSDRFNCTIKGETSQRAFKFDPKNGKMMFSAKNVDLTGLACPIEVTVTIGDHITEIYIDEDIVNGTRQPCPPQFLMGIRDWMMVDQAQVRLGKKPGTDTLSVKGFFTIGGQYDKANPLMTSLGQQTFTVSGDQFACKGTSESCNKGVCEQGPQIKAKFDFAKCSFQIQVKNAVIQDCGEVDFGLNCFGNLLPEQTVDIPEPKSPRYELERYRCYNQPGRDWTYTADYTAAIDAADDLELDADDAGSMTGYISVGDSLLSIDGQECYTISASAADSTVSTAWYEDYYGTHQYTWGNFGGGMAGFEAVTESPLTVPKLLEVGKTFKDSASFTGDYELSGLNPDLDVYDFGGKMSLATTLLGFESVTVPYNGGTTFDEAAKVHTLLTLKGTMQVDFYDPWTDRTYTFRANFQATMDQTWWGVEDIGVVKSDTAMEMTITLLGEKILVTMTETDQLTGYSSNPVNQSLPVPLTASLAGRVVLPSQSPLQPNELLLNLISDRISLGVDGSFSGFNAIDEDNPQNVMIEKYDGTLIATAVILPSDVRNGYVTIGTEQMALGLINMNPYVMVLSPEKQVQVLNAARNHPDFDGLVTDITNALIDAPELMMEYEAYPYIYQKSVKIGIETIQNMGSSQSMQMAYQSLEVASAGITIGNQDDPHIKDASGGSITLVNPKMNFYGVQANNLHNLVRGKETLVTFGFWPPIQWTDPAEKGWNLGDGTFHLTYYKGFNIGTNGWLSYTHGAGKATYANFTKAVFIILDVAGIDVFSLSDAQIEALLLLDNIPSIDFSSLAPQDSSDFRWDQFITNVLDFVIVHWDDFAYWVYQESAGWVSDSDNVTRYLRQSRQIVEGVLSALGPVSAIMDLVNGEMVNEWIPFFYDLIFAPSMIDYTFMQSNGVISLIEARVPPTAYFTADATTVPVGETVTFDASTSYDDFDAASALQVRWDFDGNGVWDTGWSTSKVNDYTYNQRGNFYPALEVRDSHSLTSVYSKNIYVGSSESFKIVLTWGAEPRDLDSHLSTPSMEGSSYHVYYASRGSANSAPYVWLDLDDTSGYGPETIWFERFYPGTYVYSVYLYSGTGTLNTSQAHVEVIGSNGVVRSFNVPAAGSGLWWNVFSIDGATRTITPINTLSDSQYNASVNLMSAPLNGFEPLNSDIYMPPKNDEE
jgi:hypothetical protein